MTFLKILDKIENSHKKYNGMSREFNKFYDPIIFMRLLPVNITDNTVI